MEPAKHRVVGVITSARKTNQRPEDLGQRTCELTLVFLMALGLCVIGSQLCLIVWCQARV